MATLDLQEISSGVSLDDEIINNNINVLNTVPLTGTALNDIPTFSPNTYISAESINNVFTKIKENWIDTSNGTADAGDILNGKIAYVDGKSIIGTIPIQTSSNLTASGATVTVPAGYYASKTAKSVSTATQAIPSISVDSAGLITASATQNAGYVSASTKSSTKQLSTQGAKTITPSTSSQTAISKGVYTTGAVTVAAVPTQTKSVTPSTSAQTITPDSGKFLSSVTVSAMSTVAQATPSISVDSSGLITASSTQAAGYVSAGTKNATKQLTVQAAKAITPSSIQQTVVAKNVYTTGDVTVAAVPTQTKSVTPTTSAQTVTPDSGKYLSSVSVGAIATQTKEVTPTTSVQTVSPDNGKYLSSVSVRPIPSTYVKPATKKAATTYTPTTSNQTIAAGTYCSGTQTIVGDTDLVSGNIKSGANIFGVAGSESVVDTSDATATASDMASGVTAYVNGSKVPGNVTTITSGRGVGPSGTISMLTKDGVPTSIEIKGTFTSDRLFRSGSYAAPYVAISNFGDATAADVAVGKTFTSAAGLKIPGNVPEVISSNVLSTTYSYIDNQIDPTVMNIRGIVPSDTLCRSNSVINIPVPANVFGGATASDVNEGVTFTSDEGLCIEGTYKKWKRYSDTDLSQTNTWIIKDSNIITIKFDDAIDSISCFTLYANEEDTSYDYDAVLFSRGGSSTSYRCMYQDSDGELDSNIYISSNIFEWSSDRTTLTITLDEDDLFSKYVEDSADFYLSCMVRYV